MGSATSRQEVSAEGIEFIRFCYGRRKVGWPEIYDEMCAVASRGLFRGWSHEDLAAHGIGFSLSGLPALAAVVRRTIDAEPLPRAASRRVGVPVEPAEEPAVVERLTADPLAVEPFLATPSLDASAEPIAAAATLEVAVGA